MRDSPTAGGTRVCRRSGTVTRNSRSPRLGERYSSIGLTFGRGELATYTGARPHRVPWPVPPLVESVLEDDTAGDYPLNLRTDAPRPVADWLAGTAVSRAIGPRHDPDDDTAHHMTGGSPAEWFDILVHRRHVTPARPLRHGEPPTTTGP
ncbi:erythromycin esterase family protein [Streptomyces sp. NPDC058375]|uniref:erythromycin esterase family protein n=1 Tax=Streptomyces sp. NPDC058375 TaxID=3346467 RepID=UPI0036652224